ncbi:hypothetical protein RESH_05258 [Rhodopirellula europaea SH398]|uniref:Uncharacterized protein n=1 Tax=Rhodopirellula europaea SH398 TaxID=1263868 RepID=M5S903_9BACT|nr:hypothetical protein RESH_05258 [Rhodopirellula europaea SH398]
MEAPRTLADITMPPRTGPSSMMRREINESLRIQDSLPHPLH